MLAVLLMELHASRYVWQTYYAFSRSEPTFFVVVWHSLIGRTRDPSGTGEFCCAKCIFYTLHG